MNRWFCRLVRLILAFVFAFSSMAHLKHPYLLLDHVLAYRIVTGYGAVGVALLLPIIEFVLAAVMLSNISARIAGLLSFPILAIFLAAQISALARGLKIDCGCFGGVVQREVGIESLFMIITMAFVSCILAIFKQAEKPARATDYCIPEIGAPVRHAKTFLKVLVVTLILVNPVCAIAQQNLPPLPTSTEALIHIQSAGDLSNELEWFRELAANDDRLRSLVLEGDDPVCTAEEFDFVIEQVERLEHALQDIESATFAIRNLASAPEYLIVVNGANNPSADLANLWSALQGHFASLDTAGGANESDQRARIVDRPDGTQVPAIGDSLQGPRDLLREIENWLKRFAPKFADIDSNTIAISNSAEWLEWTKEAIQMPSKEDILHLNRRFQRALKSLNPSAQESAVIWFVPEILFPLWNPKLTPEELRRFGYEELVGAAACIRIGNRTTNSNSRFSLKLAVPFTVPATGIVSLWQSFEPISKLPSLAKYCDESDDRPWELIVQNQNRQKYFELLEAVYTARGEAALFEERMTAESQWHPDLENYRNYLNGQWVRMTMLGDKPKPQFYSLDFLGIGNRESTLKYARHSAAISERDSGYAKPEGEIEGFSAWFRSKDDNWKMVCEDQPEAGITIEDRHLLRNMGMVVSEHWLLQGDESQIREYLGTDAEELSPASQVLKQVGVGVDEVLDSVSPSWVSYRFPGTRRDEIVKSLRVYWLSQAMPKFKAREAVYGWDSDTRFEESIPVTSMSDRLFGVAEWVVFNLLSRHNSDVQMFASREGHFEWHWYFFGELEE